MGTNYYHRTNICEKCGRFDETHIGKSSWGWTFSFHGPNGVSSYANWLKTLSTGKIFDEYDEEVELSDFKNLIEDKRNAEHNHTIYCRNTEPEHAYKDCWLDEEGNSFCRIEFS